MKPAVILLGSVLGMALQARRTQDAYYPVRTINIMPALGIAWAVFKQKSLLQFLEADLKLSLALELAHQLTVHECPRIYIVDSLPQAHRRAMCVPPVGIFVRRPYAQDAVIIHHELVHWRQYRAMGLASFYARYLSSYLIDGYANMEMERAAWYPPSKEHLVCMPQTAADAGASGVATTPLHPTAQN